MPSMLSMGAGASEGLDVALQRMLEEERLKRLTQATLAQQTETGRHNLKTEELGQGQLEALKEDRTVRANETAQKNREMADARFDTNVTRQIALRPIDQPDQRSFATPEEKTIETAHGVPSALYGDYEPPNLGMSTETKEVGPTQGGMPWRGTQDQITKARTASKEARGSSSVQDVEGGPLGHHLVRVYDDGSTEAVTDKDTGNVLKGFHQPPSPQFVQTGSGYMTKEDVAKLLKEGKNVPLADPAQVRNRRDMATAVGSHFEDAQNMLDEANSRGLLGPLAGRTFTDFLAGRVGSTGNAQDDELLGDLRTSLSMIRSGTASLHGRSGANFGIAQDIQKKMDEGHMSYNELTGGLRALKKWVDTYASGGKGQTTSDVKPDLIFDPTTGTFKKP